MNDWCLTTHTHTHTHAHTHTHTYIYIYIKSLLLAHIPFTFSLPFSSISLFVNLSLSLSLSLSIYLRHTHTMHPYYSLPLEGIPEGIQRPHTADESKFSSQLTLLHPRIRFHRRTSFISLSLPLQQCPISHVSLTWIFFGIGKQVVIQLLVCGMLLLNFNRTKYHCLVTIYLYRFKCFIEVLMCQSYYTTDAATGWYNFRFIVSERKDLHTVDYLSIADHNLSFAYVSIIFIRWDTVTMIYEIVL